MYIDYVVSAPSGSDYEEANAIIADLAGVFDGTITDKADFNTAVCNVSLSEFSGTLPAEFDTTSVFYNAATSNSDDTILKFTKKHEEASATFDYKKQFALYWEDGAYGLRMRIENPTVVGTDRGTYNDDRAPGNGDIAILHSHDGTNGYTGDILDGADLIERIRIYATRSYVVFQFTSGIGTNTYTFGIFDKDANAFDEAAYNLDSTYAPMMYISDINNNFADPNNYNTYSQDYKFVAGVLGYMGSNGTYYTSPSNHYTHHPNTSREIYSPYYQYPSYQGEYMEVVTTMPAPSYDVGIGNISGVDSHIVLPVFAYCPSATNNGDAPQFFGQLPRFYRTTSEIAAPGTTITESGIDYVVLSWHHCGDKDYWSEADSIACYLVPKTAGDT